MVYDPEILGDGWVMRKLYYLIQSPSVLFESFATTTYAFIIFCLTAWFLLGDTRSLHMETVEKRINYRAVISILLWLIPILMGITIYVMYITGICRMGADNPNLPFRLAGWINYIRITLIPALLLLLIWCSDKADLRKHFSFGIILLFLHGLSDMLLRSSRGAILMPFILLTMLFLVTGRITKKRVQVFVIIFIITIILFPIISSYRYLRATDLHVPIGSSLVDATINVSSGESFSFFEMLKGAGTSIIFRFTGADSLLHIIGAGVRPLYAEAFTGSINVTKFFTVDVIGFSPDAIHGSAPSFLGWFYLVGGNRLVVIGMACLVFLSWFCWRLLAKLKLRCLPVAQALLLWWIFRFFSEGVLDHLYLMFLVIAGSIAACEWLVRRSRSVLFLKTSGVSKSREYAGVE